MMLHQIRLFLLDFRTSTRCVPTRKPKIRLCPHNLSSLGKSSLFAKTQTSNFPFYRVPIEPVTPTGAAAAVRDIIPTVAIPEGSWAAPGLEYHIAPCKIEVFLSPKKTCNRGTTSVNAVPCALADVPHYYCLLCVM